MTLVLVERSLFEVAGLRDAYNVRSTQFGMTVMRRLLVVAWLLAGGVAGYPPEQSDADESADPGVAVSLAACTAAAAFWTAHPAELRSWRPATLTTVLFQLEQLGLVESFAAVDEGFHVKLREVG